MILQAHAAETASPGVQLGRGRRGWKSNPYFFGGEENSRAFGSRDGCRLPWAAVGCLPARALPLQPVCPSHAAELPGAARAVRKTGRRMGGLWAGSREHGSSWETLRGPGQERPLCRGRAAAGTAAPLVLHIPERNGIFGGRRAPGRNSRAAFGVQPWLSCWDPELQQWEWGFGGVAVPFGLGKASP